jgi:hypothetical protein
MAKATTCPTGLRPPADEGSGKVGVLSSSATDKPSAPPPDQYVGNWRAQQQRHRKWVQLGTYDAGTSACSAAAPLTNLQGCHQIKTLENWRAQQQCHRTLVQSRAYSAGKSACSSAPSTDEDVQQARLLQGSAMVPCAPLRTAARWSSVLCSSSGAA